MTNRAVVIADYTGAVHAVLPVQDTFTLDDLNEVKEKAEYYNQTAHLVDVDDESSCVGEIEAKIAELNGDDPEEGEEGLGQMKIDKIPEQIVKTTEKLVAKKLLVQFFLIGLLAGFLEHSVPADGCWLLLWVLWIIVVIFKKAGQP